MRGARNSSRSTEAIAWSTRSSVTPCGRSCSATILCAGVPNSNAPKVRGYNQHEPFGVVGPLRDPAEMASPGQAEIPPGQTYGPRPLARAVRASIRAGVRAFPRLLPDSLAVRAGLLPDWLGGSACSRDVHAGFLPPGT